MHVKIPANTLLLTTQLSYLSSQPNSARSNCQLPDYQRPNPAAIPFPSRLFPKPFLLGRPPTPPRCVLKPLRNSFFPKLHHDFIV